MSLTTPQAQKAQLDREKHADKAQGAVQKAPAWVGRAEQLIGSQKPKKHQVAKRADRYVGGKIGEGVGAAAGAAIAGPGGAVAGKTIGKIAGQTLGAKNIVKGAVKAPKIMRKGARAVRKAPMRSAKAVSSRVTPGRFGRWRQKRRDKNFIKDAKKDVPGAAELLDKAKKIYKKLVRGANPLTAILSFTAAGAIDAAADPAFDLFATATLFIGYILLPLQWLMNGIVLWIFKKVVIPRLGLRKVKDVDGYISSSLAVAVKGSQFIIYLAYLITVLESIPWISTGLPGWTILVILTILFSMLIALPARLEYHRFKKGQVAKPLKQKIGRLVQQYERQQMMMEQVRRQRAAEAQALREAQEGIGLAA